MSKFPNPDKGSSRGSVGRGYGGGSNFGSGGPDFGEAGLKLLGVAAFAGIAFFKTCNYSQADEIPKIFKQTPKHYEPPIYPKYEPPTYPKYEPPPYGKDEPSNKPAEEGFKYPEEANDLIEAGVEEVLTPSDSSKYK